MMDSSFDSLADILRAHDVPYDHDSLKSAFNDPESQTVFQGWMQEYLSPETLLSKDEEALYSMLLKSGNADALAASQDLSAFPTLDDEDIHEAIEELRRSTIAIEKQTETLQLQQNAMSMLVKDNTRLHQGQSQAIRSQQGKWEMEMGNTIIAVEEISRNLKYQTAELEQESKTSERAVKARIEDILRSDDKLLSSLQKLASDIDPVRSEDDDTIVRIKELCARLIKYTVEGVRTKLDRIYLSTLKNSARNADDHDATGQEVADLQNELESLYAEILPVAQMSVEQQYLEPALREISAKNGQGQDRSVKAVKYMHECLQYLVKRTKVFVEHAQEHQCHKMAMQYILEEAKNELQRTEVLTTNRKLKSAKPSIQRKMSLGPVSPVRKRTNRRRSSAGYIDDEIEPEQQLFRNLGVSLPVDASSDQARIETLEKTLLDRANKLEGHTNNLQSSTESSISSHLLDAHVTLHLLRNSLLAESPYHSVNLLNADVESSLSTLENDIEGLQEGLGEIDLQKLQKNVHREKLVERWTR